MPLQLKDDGTVLKPNIIKLLSKAFMAQVEASKGSESKQAPKALKMGWNIKQLELP